MKNVGKCVDMLSNGSWKIIKLPKRFHCFISLIRSDKTYCIVVEITESFPSYFSSRFPSRFLCFLAIKLQTHKGIQGWFCLWFLRTVDYLFTLIPFTHKALKILQNHQRRHFSFIFGLCVTSTHIFSTHLEDFIVGSGRFFIKDDILVSGK
jgi:hypothetical protein